MKRIAIFASACTLAAAIAVPVMGQTKEEKDQCLLYSKSCANEVMSIQEKIKKLNQEVKKGKKVYSTEELKRLEQKLKDANEMVDSLMKQGGSGK